MTNAVKQIHLFIFSLARLMFCVWHLFPNERLALKYTNTLTKKGKTSLDGSGRVRVKTGLYKRIFAQEEEEAEKSFLEKARRANLWK